MLKCRWIDFLFSVLPIKRWQDFLVRRHIQNCPECQDKLATVEEARELFVPESEIENLQGVWPAIQSRQDERRGQKPQAQRRWRWAFAAAFLFIVLAGAVWLYLAVGPGKGSPEPPFAEQFQINSIEIDNQPAQAFVYHPRDSKTYFVWVEKKT
jgi:hypothetical protein